LREKLLLCAAALVAFGGSLGGVFQYDDFSLFSDPAVTSPSGWLGCWRLLQTRPLTWLSFWANYQIGGENPLGYHAVNLLLHLAVVLLLRDLLAKLIPVHAALAAAAVFAVHPALAEPVNYIFARATVFAAVFVLLALRAWVHGRPWHTTLWYLAAMLAKEECAALPLFLYLMDWSRGNTVRWKPLLAMAAAGIMLGLRVVWAASAVPGSQAGAQAGISSLRYFAAQGPVVWGYLQRLVFPWGFTPDYEVPLPPPALAAAAAMGIIVLAMFAARHMKALGTGFWFLGALLLLSPSSSIFPAADLASDRRMYLPMIALSACFGLLLAKLHRRVTVVLVLVLAALSIYYTSLWRSPELLWKEAVARAPAKVRPRIQLARASEPAKALTILDEAQLLAPDNADIAEEQGRILLGMGRAEEALVAFGRGLALDPGNARGLNNRAAALAALGQTDAARLDFMRALERDPCLYDARLNLKRLNLATRTPPDCRFTPSQQSALEK
jgi:hypothetical protein